MVAAVRGGTGSNRSKPQEPPVELVHERKKVRTRSNKGKRDQKRIPKCVQKRHQPPDEDDDEVVELPRAAC